MSGGDRNFVRCNGVDNIPRIGQEFKVRSREGEVMINNYDVISTSYCVFPDANTRTFVNKLDAWMKFYWYTNGVESYLDTGSRGYYAYKIHLNSSFKLGSGTGDYANPYILEEK